MAPELQEALDSGEAQPDDSVWPTRFTLDELIERQAAEGKSTYGMQYAMLTTLGDELRYPLKLQDVMVFPVQRDKAPLTMAWGTRNDHGGSTRYEEVPSLGFGTDCFYSPIMFDKEWSEYTGTYMFVDPSGKGADKTAIAIVSHLAGNLFVKCVKGLEGGYQKDTLASIVHHAQLHSVDQIFVEDNFGSAMFTALLEPILQEGFIEKGESKAHPDGWKCSIEGIRVHGQKEVRIISCLEPLANQHRLIWHPEVAGNQDLQRQWTMITRERNCLKHDDEIDALASCCNQWLEVMNLDQDVTANRKRTKWFEAQLADHYKKFGMTMRSPSWIKRR